MKQSEIFRRMLDMGVDPREVALLMLDAWAMEEERRDQDAAQELAQRQADREAARARKAKSRAGQSQRVTDGHNPSQDVTVTGRDKGAADDADATDAKKGPPHPLKETTQAQAQDVRASDWEPEPALLDWAAPFALKGISSDLRYYRAKNEHTLPKAPEAWALDFREFVLARHRRRQGQGNGHDPAPEQPRRAKYPNL